MSVLELKILAAIALGIAIGAFGQLTFIGLGLSPALPGPNTNHWIAFTALSLFGGCVIGLAMMVLVWSKGG